MANITQKINSYVHGISMQPDHLKSPGQVRDLVNGLPDVMAGLMKRPGSQIHTNLNTTSDGNWFHILRDDQEKYLGQLKSDGFKIWNLLTGDPRTVKYSRSPDINKPTYVTYADLPYLQGAAPDDIKFLTINDYTIVLNTKKITGMGNAVSDEPKYEAFVSLNSLEYNAAYKIDLTEPDAIQTDGWKAAAISVSPFPRWSIRDDNGYRYIGTKTFTVNHPTDTTKTGLRFTLTANARWTGVPGYYDETTYDVSYTFHNGGNNWRKGDQVSVNLSGKSYTITVTEETKSVSYSSFASAFHLTPKDSATNSVSIADVLTALKTQLETTNGVTCKVIGSGLYITYNKKFSVFSSGGQTSSSLKGFTTSINDVGDLPSQCKDGYVVKVANSAADEDDYYLKFEGVETGADGTGSWEETVKPDIKLGFDYDTMPHQLVRMSDATFLLCPIDWEPRLVGDEKTNPEPSFVGKAINKCLFYRNRLTFLSDENIIQSQSGDYFNFFVNTAMIVTDNDPIDLAATSTSPCELSDAVPMKIGLVLFSRDRQFLYGTTLDVLSPTTAKIETLSTYDWNEHLPVVDMGVTIGFASTAGKYSRFFELTNLESNNSPEALEQSKVVSELLPKDIDTIAESKESTLLSFAKKGTSRVYMYRYFNDGAKRLLSSWFKWDITGNLYHHFIDKDRYYTVVANAGTVFLAHHELSVLQEDYFVGQTGISYAPRLDLRFDVNKSDLSYDYKTDLTTFTTPFPVTTDLHVFVRESGKFEGRSAPVTSVTSGNVVAIKGDWSTTNLTIGYPFQFKVELPTIHYTKEASENKTRSDTRSYLTVHRVKFQLADIGIFNLAVTARSKGTKNLVWEMSPADDYKANMHEVLPLVFQTVPCYEKNTNLDLVLTSDHPSPAVLLSMEWEGKLSTKYYTSV